MWKRWTAWRRDRRQLADERRMRDFCSTCEHPWGSHHAPEGCEDCDYDIVHGFEGAPATPCMESEPDSAAVVGAVPSAGLADLLVEQERQVVVDDRGVLLSPAQALAGRRLDRVLTSDLPDLAARWLVSGWDSSLLRELAGHPRQDAGGIDVVWAGVMQELGLDSNVGEEQALLLMLPVQLARWRCSELSSRELAEELSRGWDTAHWDRVAGLGELLLLEEYRYEVSNAELGDVEGEREALVEQLVGATILIRR